jgi:hypothetical protein
VTTDAGWHLEIDAGGASHYRLSQLDDQGFLRRDEFAWRPPLVMTLRARAATQTSSGTWGFGLWNDPYPLAFGRGGRLARPPALPQAAWFFYSSSRSYISFQNNKPARGFLAQSFSSQAPNSSLVTAGLLFAFAPRASRRYLGRRIGEDSATVQADPSEWHSYEIHWDDSSTAFWVDKALVLECAVSPCSPLGMVIWVDNQFAAFEPGGQTSWGFESTPSKMWLDVADLQVKEGASVATQS